VTHIDAAGRPRVSAGALGAAVLFVVYVLTLAPDVTFWDAGEFIAAAHSLGIPHPPGTPLFILLVNVWGKLFFFLPYAVATNLFSAAATALAVALSAQLVNRATGHAYMAFASALIAGGMSSAWLNATETEVYAASLALGVLMIWAGERAGRGDERWTFLTAYLIALAVPLHLSALVAAPAAIALSAMTAHGLVWRRVLMLGGVLTLSMAVGRMSTWLGAVGLALMVAAFWPFRRRHLVLGPMTLVWVSAIGISVLAFLFVRARFDPTINQGDPSTWIALTDAVARRQYAVSPMWPRMAPLWVQLGNLGQYADWQIALSAGPTVLPSVLRTVGTLAFLYVGYVGAVTHWRADRRTFIAFAVLLSCGTLGVLVYLNLHAGPSIGYGIFPANTVREARERDYFYVWGFWTWGLWAGMGAIALARRWARPAWTGLLIALIPIVMNWRAVTRRGEPDETLPRAFAEGLLESTPRDGVLFVMGDNDSYPLWFLQRVERTRPDVAVVTVPLLPTSWYRDEIAHRYQLLADSLVNRFDGKLETAAMIAENARKQGRPVVAAVTMTAEERKKLSRANRWMARGLVYVAGSTGIDTVSTRRWAEWVRAAVPRGETREAIDPVNSYHRRLLDCPEQLGILAQTADSTRLDSACNYR
jgi:transmembrane protein TMEM260 (protein O-mannosyltransferase)